MNWWVDEVVSERWLVKAKHTTDTPSETSLNRNGSFFRNAPKESGSTISGTAACIICFLLNYQMLKRKLKKSSIEVRSTVLTSACVLTRFFSLPFHTTSIIFFKQGACDVLRLLECIARQDWRSCQAWFGWKRKWQLVKKFLQLITVGTIWFFSELTSQLKSGLLVHLLLLLFRLNEYFHLHGPS